MLLSASCVQYAFNAPECNEITLALTSPIPYTLAVVFAIVHIAGTQERAEEGMKLSVPRLAAEVGATVKFGDVYLLSANEGEARIGNPTVLGASVEAKVLAHGKDDKIRVYKMRRRKRTRRTHGHRQRFTEIEVTKING